MMRLGLIVPFYKHEHAIRHRCSAEVHGHACWLIDDGSDARCAPVLDEIAARESAWLKVIRCPVNRGKGIAVLTGFLTPRTVRLHPCAANRR
jgi:glycosyltransferase involved in cell wall biosynthesis